MPNDNYARRIERSLISGSGARDFFRRAVLIVGALFAINSLSLQLAWIAGLKPDFITYKMFWGAAQGLSLIAVLALRRRIRKDAGITILEQIGFRLLIINILAAIIISLVISTKDWVKPIATNTILSLIHFLCFAIVPPYIDRSFMKAALMFAAAGFCMMMFPPMSDAVYGVSWLAAALVLFFQIGPKPNRHE